ncbi:MAG TPA: hypothetical protein VGG33_09045 [Polyangia bacterium]
MRPIRDLLCVPRSALLLGVVLFAATGTACDDDVGPDFSDAGANADGGADTRSDATAAEGGAADVGADAATDVSESDGAVDGVGFLPAPAGLVVLSSDRMSTSIGLAALNGTSIVKDRCLHSGSVSPRLSAALSGDVVLPTEHQPNHEIVAIDRKNGTLTWVDPANCEVLRQMNTGAGFASNPYDLIAAPGGKGYVPRYNLNPGNPAEGSDVLVIDTTTAQVTGRIDLRPHVTATVPPAKALLPFPSRGVLVGDKIYLALNHFSADYMVSGVGRLVVIDTKTDSVVETIDLTGLKNCGVVTPVFAPGGQSFVVGCSGPFSDGPAQIDSAGVAWVDVSKTPAEVNVIPSKPFGRPVSGFDVAGINGDFLATVVPGEFGMAPFDSVWTFERGGLEVNKLYEADSSFVLALGIDPWRRRLYVLDAAKSEPLVHVFAVPLSNDPPLEIASFPASPATGLPPRQFGFY